MGMNVEGTVHKSMECNVAKAIIHWHEGTKVLFGIWCSGKGISNYLQ